MKLPKQPKRDKVLTVRITADTFNKLASMAEKANMSQADAVEYWVNLAWTAEKYRPKGKGR